MTVRQWLETWLDTIRAEVSPKTLESYAEIVRCYLTPALGGNRIDRLAPSQIQKAYNGLTRRDGKPLSPRHGAATFTSFSNPLSPAPLSNSY